MTISKLMGLCQLVFRTGKDLDEKSSVAGANQTGEHIAKWGTYYYLEITCTPV